MSVIFYFQPDAIRRVCKLMGLTPKGNRYDMIQQIIKASVSKVKFENAFAKVRGHSGGWLSAVCPHNVVYAIKFLIRSESPRDYTDIIMSLKNIPTVNIIDIAHSVAKISNTINPGMFPDNEGRLAPDTPENVLAANENRIRISIPALSDNQPVINPGEADHPITGLSKRFVLFDWFHQDNTSIAKEALRKASYVKEIAGIVNTQAAEQLHRDRKKDVYWLSSMTPSNHILLFKLICHLQNTYRNDAEIKRQTQKMGGVPLELNQLGQLVRQDMDQAGTAKKDKRIIFTIVPRDEHAQPSNTVPTSPTQTSHVDADAGEENGETTSNEATGNSKNNKRRWRGDVPHTDAGNKKKCPAQHNGRLPKAKTSARARPTRKEVRAGNYVVYEGQHLAKQDVGSDGNCMFRAVALCAQNWTEKDHTVLRLRAYQWALQNKHLLETNDELQIQRMGVNGNYGERSALIALANVLRFEIVVLFYLHSGLSRERFSPYTTGPMERIHLFWHVEGAHYESLLPVEINRAAPQRLARGDENKWPCMMCGRPQYAGGCVGCSHRETNGVICPSWACFHCVGLFGVEPWLLPNAKRWFCCPEHAS